jgi:hypothetical protein
MRSRGLFFAGLLVVVAFAAVMTWSMHRYLQRPLPKAWANVDAFVHPQQRRGDAVMFFPAWLAGYARDGGLFDGLTGIAPTDLRGAEGRTVDRVWVLECFGDFDPALVRDAGFDPVLERRIAGITARLYQQRGSVSFRLSDRLPSASVAVRLEGEERPLEWKADGWSGRGDARVEARWGSFRKQPKQGALVPVRRGRDVVFGLAGVPAGDLVVCGGITDYGLFSMAFAPARAWLWIDGVPAGSARFEGRSGWYCTQAGRIDHPGDLRLLVSSAVRKPRLFLIDLFVTA